MTAHPQSFANMRGRLSRTLFPWPLHILVIVDEYRVLSDYYPNDESLFKDVSFVDHKDFLEWQYCTIQQCIFKTLTKTSQFRSILTPGSRILLGTLNQITSSSRQRGTILPPVIHQYNPIRPRSIRKVCPNITQTLKRHC